MKKIVIYSKVPCPYCVAAKNFLNDKGIPFEEIDLTHDMDQLQRIKEHYGWRTVPLILIDGTLVGGYTDLKAMDENGELDKLLIGASS